MDAKRPYCDRTIAQHFEVPGCVCKAGGGDFINQDCPCRISPCIYDAIKALQAQQVAQTTSIHDLREIVQEIEDLSVPIPDVVATSSPVPAPVAEQVTKWLSGVGS